jgi:ABC-type oligopeptide transport system substrate-binding subunit
VLTLVLALAGATWVTAGLPAQDPGQKPSGKDKEEVEEPGGGRPKRKVIPVDDDDKPSRPRTRPRARPSEDLPSDIDDALRQTRNPELKEFLGSVKTPHDAVTIATSGRTYFVKPLQNYYPDKYPKFKGSYTKVTPLDPLDGWKAGKPFEVHNSSDEGKWGTERVRPYEELVGEAARDFLKKGLDRLPEGSKSHLSRQEMLQAAEAALASADRWHAAAEERGERARDGQWDPVVKDLRRQLFDVRLLRLELLANAGDWDQASAYARRLAELYPTAEEREPMAKLLVRLIQEGLKGEENDNKFREARQRLRLLEDSFPNTTAAGPVAEGLKKQAELLLKQAQDLIKAGNTQEALNRLALAQDIWPRLAGLNDEVLRLNRQYPVLIVGVRDLPADLLPGLAATDVEQQAVELMFESLVRLRDRPGVGQRYESELAAGLPRLVPLGREFRLSPHAFWSNDEPISAADVATTVRLLSDPKWPGANPALVKLLDTPNLGGDAFRVTLNLKQGYLDPLSLMTFKVMPRQVQGKVEQFRKEPVGSGPFRYAGQLTTQGGGRTYARFVANPNYASRDNKLGLPRIREIHLLRLTAPEDPVDLLLKGARATPETKGEAGVGEGSRPIDLVADVPASRVAALREAGGLEVKGPLANRRVYFLALNHRQSPLKDNPDLRRALANAIDRNALLDAVFRKGGVGKEVHRPLNGPYPPGSWACSPNVQPYTADLARSFARRAREKGGRIRPMSLKYPAADPLVAEAMQALAKQVKETVEVELVPEAVEPHKLREAVEKTHDYDLAYWHYDYPSEAYWLWPLFDPNGTDQGSNYLGYVDGSLDSLFGQAMEHRDFGKVQEATRLIHELLAQQMPLVPLWQLDTFVAYRKEVKPAALDPLLVFSEVERWTKEMK